MKWMTSNAPAEPTGRATIDGQWTMNLAGALVATAIVVGQRLILARYALMLAVLEESSGLTWPAGMPGWRTS
jgi:hypothetical protein